MDLSFTRFVTARSSATLPTDLAVLMVGVAARQAASPTAMLHARLALPRPRARLLCPGQGAFHPAVAQALKGWKQA